MLVVLLLIVIFGIAIQQALTPKKHFSLYESDQAYFPTSVDTSRNQFNSLTSKYILYKLEKYMVNWRDILDIVSFNKSFVMNDSARSIEKFEMIIKTMDRKTMYFTPGNVAELVDKYGDMIKEQCTHYKLDWRIILAMIRQESYFNPNAVSRAGAYGFMQIMPRTGQGLQNELNLEDTKTPANNLTAGMYYYATLVGAFEFTGEEKYKFALAAYNAGLQRVVDAMTITNYFGKDYNKWDNVKESYPYLASNQDSIQKLVWPKSGRPPGGNLNNWMEPYKYVEYIIFYYENYKQYYPNNLEEPKKKNTTKKKKKSK